MVLLVDDEVEILEIMADELKTRGIDFLCAQNGKDALEIIEREKPGAILSDYRMPELNGMELLAFLSDLKITTPVIWLTAYAQKETFREAWRLGVYDFFEKPFRVNEIADHLVAALDLSEEELLNRKPRFLNKDHFRTIDLDIEIETFDRLKEACLKESISMSHYIGKLIQQKLG